MFEGLSDFNPGTARTDLMSFGGVDTFISKLNVDGTHVFSRQQGGAGNDFAYSLALDGSHNILTTGHFESTADFDPRGGRLDIASNGATDIFVSKLTQEIVYRASEVSNRFELRRNGTNLELLDRISTTVLVSRPLSLAYGVKILDGAYELTVNYNYGGQFSLAQGIEFVGRSTSTDSITVLGTGSENVGYVPNTIYGNGSMTVSSGADSLATIWFSRVENAKVSGLYSLYFVTLGGADSMRAAPAKGHAGSPASRISGASGGGLIVPLTFDNVEVATIDLASSDFASSSTDRFTFLAGGYSAAGLRTLDVYTGIGDDVLTVKGTSLNLPGGGAFTYHPGDQVDQLVISGDANQYIRASAVDMGPGTGSIQFSSLEKATLNGGVSANTLSAVGFGGTTTMHGEAGNDVLFGSSQADILYGGKDNDIISGGRGNDSYHGQDGTDTYILIGSETADDLRLTGHSASVASFVRRDRKASLALETDLFVFDSSDVFNIDALSGNDLISIDLAFANLGTVDGGSGTDTCTAPSSWTRISCEL
jgi:Ca2+-binding RTX toxin-like protein